MDWKFRKQLWNEVFLDCLLMAEVSLRGRLYVLKIFCLKFFDFKDIGLLWISFYFKYLGPIF